MKINKFALLFFLVISFSFILVGCSQGQQAAEENQIVEQPTEATEPEANMEEMPEDYEGVWLRTATYADGVYVGSNPATFTLNRNSYTSVSSMCSSQGLIDYKGENTIVVSQQSTNCINVPQSLTYTYTYSMVHDKERDVEVMTIVTGSTTETYDRQS